MTSCGRGLNRRNDKGPRRVGKSYLLLQNLHWAEPPTGKGGWEPPAQALVQGPGEAFWTNRLLSASLCLLMSLKQHVSFLLEVVKASLLNTSLRTAVARSESRPEFKFGAMQPREASLDPIQRSVSCALCVCLLMGRFMVAEGTAETGQEIISGVKTPTIGLSFISTLCVSAYFYRGT